MICALLFIFSHILNDADETELLIQKELETKTWVLPSQFVIQEGNPKNDFGWLVKEAISEFFSDQGKTVYHKEKEDVGVLTFRVINLSVEYNKTHRLFSNRFERNIKGEIYLSFVDSMGIFRWSQKIYFEGMNKIKKSDLKRMFINGLSPRLESNRSILMPLLVTLSVGALIMALYTVGY